jgi:TRAP transporter TAXI family solute receptor
MEPHRTCALALVLTIATTMLPAAADQPARTQLRFRIASEGGFDQRGFVNAYASALSGIDFQMVTSDISGTGLEELQNGTADLTINVSQTAYAAYSAQLETPTDRHDQLRAIANLGVAPLHFVARTDSGIRTVGDLRGRSVNLGVTTGENYRLAQSVLEAFGLGAGTYTPHHLSYSEAVAGLLGRKFEAMFIVGSYPGRGVLRATEGGVARLLPIQGKPADRLRQDSAFLRPALIPAGTYPGQLTSIRTVGVQHVLVCRRDLTEDAVFELTKQLFAALPRLAAIMNTIRSIDIYRASATSIPLHNGAARYYRAQELSR